MIEKFTESLRSAFPYGLVAKDGQKIFSTDLVPEKFCLSDPDHFNASDVNALYHHWLGQQKGGLEPFVILNLSPQHGMALKIFEKGKGKARKSNYVGIDSEKREDKVGKACDQEHDNGID